MRFAPVGHFSDLKKIVFNQQKFFVSATDLNILQGNDTARFLVRGELKVVETIIIENEPSSLPALVSAALLPQPTLLVRIEEGVHQIIAIILRDLEWFSFDALIQRHQQLLGQVLTIIDTSEIQDCDWLIKSNTVF